MFERWSAIRAKQKKERHSYIDRTPSRILGHGTRDGRARSYPGNSARRCVRFCTAHGTEEMRGPAVKLGPAGGQAGRTNRRRRPSRGHESLLALAQDISVTRKLECNAGIVPDIRRRVLAGSPSHWHANRGPGPGPARGAAGPRKPRTPGPAISDSDPPSRSRRGCRCQAASASDPDSDRGPPSGTEAAGRGFGLRP